MTEAVEWVHASLLKSKASCNVIIGIAAGGISDSAHIIGSRMYESRGRYLGTMRTSDDWYSFRVKDNDTFVFKLQKTDA